MKAKISGIGVHIPEKVLTNAELEKLVDTSDEWITSRTGINERRIINENQSTSDIGTIAAKEAIKDANLSPEDIDLIINTSLSPDMVIPSTAALIQGKVGALNAAAFDVSAACAGFSYGLTVASQFIETGAYKNVLLVGAEAVSRFIDYNDRKTCILFGDGAGAVVLGAAQNDHGILGNYLGADGTRWQHIQIPGGGSAVPASANTVKEGLHYIKMNGNEVFKFAVRVIPKAIKEVLNKTGLRVSDIDLLIPHQANKRIIDSAIKKIDIDPKKVFINLDKFGNTSAASLPLALYEAREKGLIKNGSLVVLLGFGAGLCWGANVVRWT